MRSRRVLLGICISASLACGRKSTGQTGNESEVSESEGATEAAGPSDPAAYYGPCTDNEWCGLGSGETLNAIGGICICVVPCEADSDCPVPLAEAVPECRENFAGEKRCVLVCAADTDCPQESICADGQCFFASADSP